MGVVDKFLNAMRLNSDEDDYFDDEFFDEEEAEEEEAPKKFLRRDRKKQEVNEEPTFYTTEKEEKPTMRAAAPVSSKVTPMRASKKAAQTSRTTMEVCVIVPISVEDAHEITETLVAGRTVILNLEGLDLEIAQRIIDFTSGSCYAMDGNLQRISNFIFLVTPSHVDISGDFQALMSSALGGGSLQTDI